MIPSPRAFSVVSSGECFTTTTSPTRAAAGASAAARILRLVASTSSLSPSELGVITMAPALVERKPASLGGRPTRLPKRSNQASARGPPMASLREPSCGSASSSAILGCRNRHQVFPSSSRIGAESARRVWASTGWRSAAVTVTRSTSTGSGVSARESEASAPTIVAAARSLFSLLPGCPSTSTGFNPLSTIAASRFGWSSSSAIWPSWYSSAGS